MKLHPRVQLVQRAHNAIDAAVCGAMKEFPDLTYLELMSIFNQIEGSWIKYGIRDERHPDDLEKRGAEE